MLSALPEQPPIRRVAVVGTSGSGKTTFAGRLAERLGLPRIELDALHWEPGWRAVEPARFRERVEAVTSAETWVIDGNYSAVRSPAQADDWLEAVRIRH